MELSFSKWSFLKTEKCIKNSFVFCIWIIGSIVLLWEVWKCICAPCTHSLFVLFGVCCELKLFHCHILGLYKTGLQVHQQSFFQSFSHSCHMSTSGSYARANWYYNWHSQKLKYACYWFHRESTTWYNTLSPPNFV